MGNEQFPEQLVMPETIHALLQEVNAKIGSLPPAPLGFRHDIFTGSLDEVPSRFTVYQIPLELAASDKLPPDLAGRVAKVGVKPKSLLGKELAYEDNYTYFSFYPTKEGVGLRKEHGVSPLSSEGYYTEEGEFDKQAYRLADKRHEREAHLHDFNNEFDVVYEREAQDLLASLREATPDLEHRKAIALAERDYQKYINRRENLIKRGVAKLLGLLGIKEAD